MKKVIFRTLLLSEVVVCFALPVYFLFWGVLSLPLWFMGWNATYATIHALCTVGGFVGIVALIRVAYYVLSSDAPAINWYVAGPLLFLGVLATWTEMTGQFAGFSLDPFWLFMFLAPTVCTAHLVRLAVRKAQHTEPNKLLHATCEDARALAQRWAR